MGPAYSGCGWWGLPETGDPSWAWVTATSSHLSGTKGKRRRLPSALFRGAVVFILSIIAWLPAKTFWSPAMGFSGEVTMVPIAASPSALFCLNCKFLHICVSWVKVVFLVSTDCYTNVRWIITPSIQKVCITHMWIHRWINKLFHL